VLAQIDPDHHSPASNLDHAGLPADVLEQHAEEVDLRLQAGEGLLALEDVEIRERGRAGERLPV
jgi:hypothetical protein